MPKTRAPDVFVYADYRQYLAAHYDHSKRHEYGYSFRVFSKRAGIRSSNYLKLVIDGKRNLTAEMAGRFARGCGLIGSAAEFFCELVAYNQATSTQERNRGYERLYRFRRFREVHQLAKEQAEYHSTWFIPALRELVRRDDFDPDPSWIAARLQPRITLAEARKGLDILLKLGLLKKSPDGRLVQTKALVTTGAGPLGHHIYNYHHTMLERAGHALDHCPREDRDVSCLTLCVSQQKLQELKQRIRSFRQELLQVAELDDSPERVVQINFQLFPLSEARAPKDAAASEAENSNSPQTPEKKS